MWKRSPQKYGTTPIPETPYQKAAQVWDNRIGSARVQAKNWRLIAFGSLALCALLTTGMIWQSAQSRITPYVVEVEANGSVRAIGPAQENFKPSDAQIANQLARFIKDVRGVSIDPVVVRENWFEAYNFATDQAAVTLNAYAQENDPFADIGQRSVTVDVISIVRSSEDSFEIRWIEKRYRGGALMGSDTYTAILSVILQPPRDAASLHKNPLGLYVHSLNWSKDLNSGANP